MELLPVMAVSDFICPRGTQSTNSGRGIQTAVDAEASCRGSAAVPGVRLLEGVVDVRVELVCFAEAIGWCPRTPVPRHPLVQRALGITLLAPAAYAVCVSGAHIKLALTHWKKDDCDTCARYC